MLNKLIFARALHRGEREKARVIADAARCLRLLHRLMGAPHQACDHHDGTLAPFRRGVHGKF